MTDAGDRGQTLTPSEQLISAREGEREALGGIESPPGASSFSGGGAIAEARGFGPRLLDSRHESQVAARLKRKLAGLQRELSQKHKVWTVGFERNRTRLDTRFRIVYIQYQFSEDIGNGGTEL